jgi:hypothetical protein
MLFPVPGLRTIKDLPIFYMKPARYFSKETPTQEVLDNLAYVLQTMSVEDLACVGGIGFLANINDWKLKSFCKDYCFEFMKNDARISACTSRHIFDRQPSSLVRNYMETHASHAIS